MLIFTRLSAFVASALVLLGGAIISLGAVLLAPLGMWAWSAFLHRRHRPASRATSWLAAMASVAVGLLAVAGFALASLPPGGVHRMTQAMDSASVASAKTPPPAWLERMAPGAQARAASGSATPPSLRTPLLIWGGGVALLFLAAIVGSLGWVGGMLGGFAVTGRWPGAPVPTP
jgi:hypothetical protein